MSSANNPLAAFAFHAGLDWWEGEVFVSLWGSNLPVRIDARADGPSPRQVETLRAVLGHSESLRERTGQALLAYYRDEWEGVTPSLGQGPLLHSTDEVWAAMTAVSLFIPAFRAAQGPVVFELHMDSRWDEDHGLCVLFRDWEVADVAGQMDCRGADS